MDYTTFKNRFSGLPVILSKDVTERMGGEKSRSASGGRQELRNQLSRWQKRGLIVKLKKGMYLLNENDRKVNPSKLFVANQIYTPSCVSLEYALGFYGLIPERVVEVTSITTKKTLRITNPVGRFSYQHVTTSAFRGFKITKDENGSGEREIMPEEKSKIVSAIAELLNGYDDFVFAYLFGSFVSEERFNDIDVALYLSSLSGERALFTELTLETELEEKLGILVDVRVVNCAPIAFVYSTLRKRLLLLDRNPDLRSDFESLIYREYFDFAYLLNEYIREIANATF